LGADAFDFGVDAFFRVVVAIAVSGLTIKKIL